MVSVYPSGCKDSNYCDRGRGGAVLGCSHQRESGLLRLCHAPASCNQALSIKLTTPTHRHDILPFGPRHCHYRSPPKSHPIIVSIKANCSLRRSTQPRPLQVLSHDQACSGWGREGTITVSNFVNITPHVWLTRHMLWFIP